MRARAEVWEKVRLDGEEDLKEEQKFERLVLVLKYFFPRSFCNIDMLQVARCVSHSDPQCCGAGRG